MSDDSIMLSCERRRLHFLLYTPLRYPPLRHGSRFGTRFERGLWYGSESRRAAGAEVLRFRSARDPLGGTHIGVLAPGAFASSRPDGFETWLSVATLDEVEVSKKDFFERRSYRFARAAFEVRGRLPSPAL